MTARDITQYDPPIGPTTYPTLIGNLIDAVQAVASGVEQAFNYNPLTTTGLTLGLFGGDEIIDGTLTVHAATTVALTASSTNYVERTRSGTVSANVSGFTAGKEPLYTAVTDTGAITTLTDKRGCNRKTYGRVAKSTTGGTTTLTVDEARCDSFDFSGTLVSNSTIEVPAAAWEWIVYNNTSGSYSLTVKVNGQTGVTVPQGKRALLWCDGTDVRELSAYARTDGTTFTGNVALSGSAVMTLAADPASALQAATKQYVDAMAAGLQPKEACRFMATSNITLSGVQSPDGGSPTNGDRIFVPNQSTASENGIYIYNNAGAWSRATDADTSAEVVSGMYVWITEGTNYADTAWVLTTNNPITLGSTALTFAQYSGVGQIIAGNGLTKSGPNTIDADNASETAVGVVELATTAETQAGTDAGRAVTPAGLAATARYQGLETMFIPAAAMRPRGSNGCAGLATTAGASNQPDVPYLAFDGASAEYAGFIVQMPKSWNGGTVTAKFSWRRASGTGAANVVWGLRAVSIADNETPAANFGTGATVTDAAMTTTANFALSGETGACTIAGTPAGNELVFFEVYRDGASGSDTLDAVDAWLSGIQILYTTNAKNDA